MGILLVFAAMDSAGMALPGACMTLRYLRRK